MVDLSSLPPAPLEFASIKSWIDRGNFTSPRYWSAEDLERSGHLWPGALRDRLAEAFPNENLLAPGKVVSLKTVLFLTTRIIFDSKLVCVDNPMLAHIKADGKLTAGLGREWVFLPRLIDAINLLLEPEEGRGKSGYSKRYFFN